MLPEGVPILGTGMDSRTKLANRHRHPLWLWGGHRGGGVFALVSPSPGEGRAGAGCPHTGAGSAGSRPRCADEMWQACNKPLVTVTFARQPLAG